MANSSMLPPMKNNGGKYALLGVLLLAGLAAGWYTMLREKEVPVATRPKAPAPVAKYEPEFVIPEPEPEPDAVEEEQVVKKRSIVTRECRGELTKSDIKDTIEGVATKQVRACYERQLKTNNRLQGTMNVLLTISPRGGVSGVRTGGSLDDRKVASCVKSVARSWKFNKPSGGCVQTVVPFSLSPKS